MNLELDLAPLVDFFRVATSSEQAVLDCAAKNWRDIDEFGQEFRATIAGPRRTVVRVSATISVAEQGYVNGKDTLIVHHYLAKPDTVIAEVDITAMLPPTQQAAA